MYSYRNTTDVPQMIPGVGTVGPDEVIKTDKILEGPNLELVGEKADKNQPTTTTDDDMEDAE